MEPEETKNEEMKILLAQYGELQLQKEAHIQQIQNIEKEMINIKINLSKQDTEKAKGA